ncbi:MAG: chromosome segregation protein SMC [Planctomycetota bacterium]
MKLRQLSLCGFKSFADRTDFVFDDGVTCIVGPNGCGKSNVVDAVKWVFGEQSAKSLRGGEMMDVIFNGSSARRSAGMAEVTLEFDNSAGDVQPDVPAANTKHPHLLSITRRLYRSGESEYLINNKTVRLRDVRELFMDTGIGGRSYSLIEQGKVAEMLQANGQERRVIFEEVAGISKYKARKLEAVRKLERVEQNLLRLNDIVGEVQKRLRSIKLQAGKARSYQTYSEQLKQLRGLYALAQYHTLSARRVELQGELDRHHDRATEITARAAQLETNQAVTEGEMADLQRQRSEVEGEIATVSGQITTCEERVEMLTRRCAELREQLDDAGRRDEELAGRIEQAEARVGELTDQQNTVELQIRQHAEQVEAMLDEQRAGQMALAALAAQQEEVKAAALDLMHRTSQLRNQITAADVRREGLIDQRGRLAAEQEKVAAQIAEFERRQQQLTDAMATVGESIEARTAELEEAKAAAADLATHEHDLDERIAEARQRHSSLAGRRSTLEEMRRRGEGLAESVKRVMKAREAGKLPFLRGMVAEVVHADYADAAVVAAALADTEQSILVERLADIEAHRGLLETVLDGRGIKLLCLDQLRPLDDEFDPATLPMAARRLTDLVRLDDVVAEPLRRLLGRTVVVDDLAAAVAVAPHLPDGYRVVTRDGAVVESDGHVRLGKLSAAGLIARDSELTQLAGELATLETRIADLAGRRKIAADQRHALDEVQQQARTAVYEARAEQADLQSQVARLGEQLSECRRQRPVVAREMETIARDVADLDERQQAARRQIDELEAASAERQEELERLGARVNDQAARQEHLTAELTEHRVQHAQALEKRTALAESMSAARRSIEQMQRERDEVAEQAATGRERIVAAEEGIALARSQIETLFARKEDLEVALRDVIESRTGLDERMAEIREALAESRAAGEAAAEQVNHLRVETGETDVRIEDLLKHAADELGVDLTDAYRDYEHDDQRDWDAVVAEIQQLRGKIERLGNVNLDAITEQEELEQREAFLAEQMRDIEASKAQLVDLIDKINATSRERFVETFAAVREQFQSIFRKLFGGGRADIVLTDPDDVLESGIDIIARPPGKELRSISLLSGGEKTLTTVALVFSIFRTRPSPFCVLDEVDAALDEANNERFNQIVEEFLDQSQFIIITHAKRTMVIADVLYGVTMQEAGVSRRVSVKFDQAAEMVDDDVPAPAENSQPIAAGGD